MGCCRREEVDHYFVNLMKFYLVKNPLLKLYLQFTNILSYILPTQSVSGKRKKILLSNIAHFGDVVLSTSVLSPLQMAMPEAEISFLGGEPARIILGNHPAIKRVHVLSHWKHKRQNLSRSASFLKTLREVKNEKYDMCIDLYPYYPNSVLFSYLAQIPERVGFTSGGWGGLLTRPCTWYPKNQHVLDDHQKLLKIIGVDHLPLKPWLPHTKKRFRKPYILLHMGSGNPNKEWKVECWRQVVSSSPLDVIVTGRGQREYNLAESLGVGQNLVNELSWEGLVSAAEHAKLILCVDSVVSHLAATFNVPSITLMPSFNDTNYWRPFHAKSVVFKLSSSLSAQTVQDSLTQMLLEVASHERCLC